MLQSQPNRKSVFVASGNHSPSKTNPAYMLVCVASVHYGCFGSQAVLANLCYNVCIFRNSPFDQNLPQTPIYIYIYMRLSVFANGLHNREKNAGVWSCSTPNGLFQKNVTNSYWFWTVCGCSEFGACIYFGRVWHEDTWLLTPMATEENKNHEIASLNQPAG